MTQRRSGLRSHQSPSASPVNRSPTPNEIASRAHDLFVAGGRRVTKISEYWQQAEQELLDLAALRMEQNN